MKYSAGVVSTLVTLAATSSSLSSSTTTSAFTPSSSSAFVPRKFSSTFVPSSRHRREASSLPYSSSSSSRSAVVVTADEAKTQQQQQQQRQRKKQNGNAGSMSMLIETSGGMEMLQELTEESDKGVALSKQARKSPSLFKLAGYASIPLSAALGFQIVPSRRIAAHAAGAVITGIAGAVGKSKLDAITEASAKPAVAQAIVDAGLDDVDVATAAVDKVRDDFGILDEDFEVLCTDIYKTYVVGMVKYMPTPKTSEIKELDNLKKVLHLSNLQVGEALATAAQEWYRQTCLFTPEEDLEDPDHPDRMAMDKLLFLTERALRGGDETEEAFNFEMTRVAKAMNVSLQSALDRVAELIEPYYERALKSTRSKLDTNKVSSAMLDRARQTLGVSRETAFDLHVACYNEEVRSLLGLSQDKLQEVVGGDGEQKEKVDMSKLKFPEGAQERLDRLQEILGLSDRDADYEIEVEATPLYQTTALAAMRDVLADVKTPDEAWEIMDDRRDDLLLSTESTKSLVASMVMQALGAPLEETNKFAKVNNEAATYDNLLEALEAKQALISILTKSGWDDFDNFDERFCDPWDKKSANGFLSTEERTKLYRIFLTRSLRKSDGAKLTDDAYGRIMEVKGLLGITDQQVEIESRAAFGPELQKVLHRATTEIVEDYTPELARNMQKQVDEVVSNYRLTEDFLREVGISFYAKAVGLVGTSAPAGIPTEEYSEALEALRNLFKLEKEDTYPSHLENFGQIYKKSVLEAMGSTGIIRPEFRSGLDDLRDRLGVSEASCKELFLEAVEEKMVPMVEWIGSEMERTMLTQQQLSQRRKKDLGEDVFQSGKGATGVLGLGAEVNIMSDIMELVDFYDENDIAREEQTGTETVEKTVKAEEEGGEDKVVAEEVPVYETVYPVTALGSDAIDQELAELLYRQFVVGAFTAQGPNAARYEESRGAFGGILGLTKDKMNEINNNIGSTVYDNFISNAMKTKGAMDQQDMMFLANIQGRLGLSSEESEKMMLTSQKKILSEEINAIMDEPTPKAVKMFREKCNAMGMDLIEDVGVSKQRLARMFEAEIIPGLKSGEVNVDDCDILGEIQESFGVEPEECETMFENVLVRLSKSAMDLVTSELLRGREDNTVDLIKEIVRYAAFTGGDLGLKVDEADAYKVVNIYEALDFAGEDADQIEANKELLEIALGIVES